MTPSFTRTENSRMEKHIDVRYQLAVVPTMFFKMFRIGDKLPSEFRVATVQDVLNDKLGARQKATYGFKSFNLADGRVNETSYGLMMKRRNDFDHQLATRPCMTIKLFRMGDQLPPQYRLATVQEVLEHKKAFLKAMPRGVVAANLADGCVDGASNGGSARLGRRNDVDHQLAIAPRVTFKLYRTSDQLPPPCRLATVQEVLHQPLKMIGPRSGTPRWVEAAGWKIANLADGYVTEAENKKKRNKKKNSIISPCGPPDSDAETETEEDEAPSYGLTPNSDTEAEEDDDEDEDDEAPSYGLTPNSGTETKEDEAPSYGVTPSYTETEKDEAAPSYGLIRLKTEAEEDEPPAYDMIPSYTETEKDEPPAYDMTPSYTETEKDEPPAYDMTPSYTETENLLDEPPAYDMALSYTEAENARVERHNDASHQHASEQLPAFKLFRLFRTGNELPLQYRLATVEDVQSNREWLDAWPRGKIIIVNLADGCIDVLSTVVHSYSYNNKKVFWLEKRPDASHLMAILRDPSVKGMPGLEITSQLADVSLTNAPVLYYENYETDIVGKIQAPTRSSQQNIFPIVLYTPCCEIRRYWEEKE